MFDLKKREAFSSLANRFRPTRDTNSFLARPPYNKDSSLFHKFCPECKEKPCAKVCEEEIIKIDKEKIPFLSFHKSGCIFCDDCAVACPEETLFLDEKPIRKIDVKIEIDISSCLAWNSVVCSSCRDICPERAIDFFGIFRPTVNMLKCTACGFCYGVCPPYAIKIKERK